MAEYTLKYTGNEIDEKLAHVVPEHNETTDEGKFLRIVNGDVVWSAVENAEEESF